MRTATAIPRHRDDPLELAVLDVSAHPQRKACSASGAVLAIPRARRFATSRLAIAPSGVALRCRHGRRHAAESFGAAAGSA